MQSKSCKTLLTIGNFQKKCERALAKRQSAIANCKFRTANSNPASRFFCMKRNIKVSFKLTDSFVFDWWGYTYPRYSKYQVCDTLVISQERWRINIIFCLKINKVFYKLISLLLVAIARYTESTLNNKFVKSL